MNTVIFAVLGACSFVVSFMQSYFWSLASENQLTRIRKLYFRSILRQDISWYDTRDVATMTSSFVEDIGKIHTGIGDKFGLFVHNTGALLGCTVVGLVMGWKLALVTLTMMPVNIFLTYLMFEVSMKRFNAEASAYVKAGAIAQEVLQSIRTVTAFGKQDEELERYASNLNDARKVATKSGLLSGFIMGLCMFFLMAMYALGFSYGVYLIHVGDPGYTIGVCLTVVFAILEGTFAFGQSLGAIAAFAESKSAASRVFHVIDRIPAININDETGVEVDKDNFQTNIEFDQVSFSYPTRKDVQVLKEASFSIEKGKTTAIVGPSGCGKSTVMQLIQRMYDPASGDVKIGGTKVSDFKLKSLRSVIGTVSQEPVLFNMTVGENIRFGTDAELSQEEVVEAAKMANAHDFISKLPKGYNTMVGEQGAQISGGQKQRIAIARALVRNPSILLLDEATSALDTESEVIVQDALDRASSGRTTIAIAHRLSTIMHADKIIVLKDGVVAEEGTHSELIAMGGVYSELVAAQGGSKGSKDTDSSKDAAERRAVLAGNKTNEAEETTHVAHELSPSELKEQEKAVTKQHFSMGRLLKMAFKHEAVYYLLGILGAIIIGLNWPVYAILISRIMFAFTNCDADDRFNEGLLFSLLMLADGAAALVGHTLMTWMFALAGEKLVLRIRRMAFKAMMYQDIAWFDKEENSPGALTTRLSTQATALKDATGGQMAQWVQIISGVIASLVISFYHEWRITLIMLCFAPMGIVASIAVTMMFADSVAQDKFIELASKAIAASTGNIRTVHSLGLQDRFIKMFEEPINKRYKKQVIKTLVIGICFGSLEAIFLFAYAASFRAAADFIEWGWSSFDGAFTALIAIMFSSYFIGMANAMAPDQAKARHGVAELFKLLDETPAIDIDGDENSLKPSEFKGEPTLENVEFHYPTRPAAKVLRGVDLEVSSGKTIALVGASGCGKSTVIQLILRFYDPVSGTVKIDNNELKKLYLPWVRSNMAIVQQEPILFDRTIEENIAYGMAGSSASAKQEDIENSAKLANIHQFVSELPDGYKTRVGEKGGQLSGGQKQRIAIARALIRQPKILLLDEATSALDSESEKIVQTALDEASKNRTSLVIAHRLSTIKDADTIAVFNQGQISELGKHDDLISQKGIYYNLWSAQSLGE